MQLIFVCLSLAAFVTLGSSLECYQCVNCEPNFIDSVTGGGDTCTDELFVEERCVKSILPDGTVTRSCGSSVSCAFTDTLLKCDGDKVVPCSICCDTDNCNGATALHISIFVIGLVAAFHKFLF